MKEKIKKYLEWKATYALRASEAYRIWLERWIQVCGDKPIEEYTISDYVKYNRWIEQRYSPYSIEYSTIIMKNFFQFYKEQNVQCLSPSLIKTPRIIAKSHRALTEDEYKLLIAQIPENDFTSLRDLVMIRLLWDTGVRVSELCDLDISQINRTKRSTGIRTKKTGKPRIIVWSEETHDLLIKYLNARNELDKLKNSTALFTIWTKDYGWSTRVNNRCVQRKVRKYAKWAGITEKTTPHSFRHGWAHKRRDQNAPLAFIQRGLGHINPISTFIYEQYNDNEFVKHANSYLNFA